MMPYTDASPRPVPRPISLVVKNGLKIFCRVSSSMPMPVSVTVRTMYLPGLVSNDRVNSSSKWVLRVRTNMRPPPGMACQALT